VPRLCEFYRGICLTTEEKARKTLIRVKKTLSQRKKNLSSVSRLVVQAVSFSFVTKQNLFSNAIKYFYIFNDEADCCLGCRNRISESFSRVLPCKCCILFSVEGRNKLLRRILMFIFLFMLLLLA
jgi:hypothetical protein